MGGYCMTREEEIRKQALKYGEPEYLLQTPNILGTQGFIHGAKWADKTMIEKACSWLEQHKEDYNKYDAWIGEYVDFKSLIIDFRKAMLHE